VKPVPAPLPALLLAAALFGCGGADEPAPPPLGEDQAVQRAEAMLQERPETPPPASPRP